MRWQDRLATALLTGAIAVPGALLHHAAEAQTLRAVMHSDLKIVDPIWTTAYITRNHGYMIYDTLFAMDANGEIQPQMVDSWTVSDDQLVYTIKLRDGLQFHDGAPVTAGDAVASLERWGRRDTMGVMLMKYVEAIEAVDDKTFTLTLARPYGLVLQSLGKPSSQVPFIMPRRIAETPEGEQISDYVGSGPFVFKTDEWKPGAIAVYEKFADYQPRAEEPSWGAGGKNVKVDRVEWVWIPDQQTAISALLSGEIDLIEQPPHDLLPILEGDESIVLYDQNPLGNQYMGRFNSLHPPFDDARIRRAAILAMNQEDYLQAVIGDPRYYKACAAMFVCGTPLATDTGGEVLLESDFEGARKLLEEAGYDGTPVVLMHSTDLQVLTNLAPVAKQHLEKAGFKVDMQDMDWQTLVSRRAKKDDPAEGGWNMFLTNWVAADVLNPIGTAALNATGAGAWFGWFDDPRLEEMKRDFAEAGSLEEQQKIAEAIQVYAIGELGTHAYLGQWLQPVALRSNIKGMLQGPAPYFWNIEKQS